MKTHKLVFVGSRTFHPKINDIRNIEFRTNIFHRFPFPTLTFRISIEYFITAQRSILTKIFISEIGSMANLNNTFYMDAINEIITCMF